jgi:ribosomal protein L30E
MTKTIIGIRSVMRGIKTGKIKSVMIAKNCPAHVIKKIDSSIEMKTFNGDQKEFGTYLGKPFCVAIAGFEEKL